MNATTTLLKASVSHEELKRNNRDMAKKIVELEEKVRTLNMRVDNLKCFAAKFCDEMEGIFRSTGALASKEIATDYVVCAQYLSCCFGRTEHFANEVMDWIDRDLK